MKTKLMRVVVLVAALFAFACSAESSTNWDEPVAADVQELQCLGDVVLTQHHYVKVSNKAKLHVVEKFTLESLLRFPRRAVLMLPASLVTNIIWNADVPGTDEYNALERAAKEGFFAYTLDYEGYGDSSQPADGKIVTAERMLDELGDLVSWIRGRSLAPRVDLIGSSIGSALAVALGGTDSPIPHWKVGRIVLTAHIYGTASALANQVIFTPENFAALQSAPNGYIDTGPEFYGFIVAFADPAAQQYCFGECPDHYAVGPTLEGFDLPVFAAENGRACMLQFWGDQDLLMDPSDVDAFQDAYGGPKHLEVLAGGGHVPHWEPVRDQFWDETFDFLEKPYHVVCGDDE